MLTEQTNVSEPQSTDTTDQPKENFAQFESLFTKLSDSLMAISQRLEGLENSEKKRANSVTSTPALIKEAKEPKEQKSDQREGLEEELNNYRSQLEQLSQSDREKDQLLVKMMFEKALAQSNLATHAHSLLYEANQHKAKLEGGSLVIGEKNINDFIKEFLKANPQFIAQQPTPTHGNYSSPTGNKKTVVFTEEELQSLTTEQLKMIKEGKAGVSVRH